MISLTASHVVVGALTLATVLLLAMRSYRALAPEREAIASETGARVVA
jgi:hypothetical protein